METELKLLLDPADVAVFRRHRLLRRHALARPATQQLTSIYFDTPDGYFRRHDAGLRVRLVQRQWIQTLKADGQVAAGLHQRQEWESPVAGAVPDLAALADLVGAHSKWGRRLQKSSLGAQLEPIFTTRFKRTLWQLRLEHGEEVELVLDQGAIVHADARVPISEIELELKSGEPAGLFAFALQLQQAVPLRVGNISKAERWAAPLADFAASTLQKCHRTLKKRVNRLQDDTPRARHRVRIAAKKLRYSSEFFQSLYRPRRMRAYLKALSGLQDRLGRLNDVALAGRLLGQLAHSHPELAYSAGLVQGYLEARTERPIRALGRCGRQCMPAKAPVLQ